MVKAVTSARRREAAVERVLAGTSTVEKEARALKIKRSAMQKFVTMARRDVAPETPATPEKTAPLVSTPQGGAPTTLDESARDRALVSAGLVSDAGAEGDTQASGQAEVAPAPAPSPEEIVDATETLLCYGASNALELWRGKREVPDKLLEAMFFNKRERGALKLFAPAVAEQYPAVQKAAPWIGIVGFGGVLAVSAVSRALLVWKWLKEKPASTGSSASPDPARPGSPPAVSPST